MACSNMLAFTVLTVGSSSNEQFDCGPQSFFAQVSIPLWALVHLPVVVTLSTAAFTPNGWVHSILYVLFENAMGIVKLGAVIAGAHRKPRPLPACQQNFLPHLRALLMHT